MPASTSRASWEEVATVNELDGFSSQQLRDELVRRGGGVERQVSQLRLRAITNLGGKCVVCGETDPAKLEIDHQDTRWLRDQAGPKIPGTTNWETTKAAAAGRIEGYQLLCQPCHRAKTTADQRAARAARSALEEEL
jgi:5-methylcytosine-specific restriction endonuclease McrA